MLDLFTMFDCSLEDYIGGKCLLSTLVLELLYPPF